MTLDSLPDLEYKRVVSCKDSFHGTDVLAVSEHGAPGRRPNIHTHFVGRQRKMASIHCRPAPPRQTEALSSRTSRSRPWKRRSQAVRERKTSVLRACRVPNPAKRLNDVQRPKTPLRATTINDFAKLGTALGGRPTIVERLPNQSQQAPESYGFLSLACRCVSAALLLSP